MVFEGDRRSLADLQWQRVQGDELWWAVLLVRVLCGGTHLEDGEAKVGLHAEVFYADLSLLAYTLRETVMHCTSR